MSYTIRSFDPQTGRIEIDYGDGAWNCFILPVDENDEFYTGEKLDQFVMHMKPPAPKVGKNADAILQLVQPGPPPEPVVASSQAKVVLARTKRLSDGTLTHDLAVEGSTLLEEVQAVMPNYPLDVQAWFTDAQTWRRFNPYVTGIGQQLGLTDAQIDELFAYAATIEV